MGKTSDIIIVGAGIIGCSIAYRLAEEGARITLIEKREPGREASWAAAGMLAPNAEIAHSVPESLARLFDASLKLYPSFISQLQEKTGIDIDYRTPGSLLVATDFQESELLAGLLERRIEDGKQVEELDAEQIRQFQHGISPSVQSGLYFPQDQAVNPRQLMDALVMALRQREVEIMTGSRVTGLEISSEKVTGVRVGDEIVQGDVVINAAGCWAGDIGPSGRSSLPVRPIRGQIACLQNQPQSLDHLLHSSECYIVPWPDGRTLIGSTLENVGFDNRVTAGGMQHLLQAATKIVPGLNDADVSDFWSGLRPDTPDNLPILGRSSFENLIVATGHFRNGILLAPVTAKLVGEMILGHEPSLPLDAFNPARFEK